MSQAGQATTPGLLCTACDVALCKDHRVAHLLPNRDHILQSFANAGSTQLAGRRRVAIALRYCEEHNRPVEYFCKQCDKPVRGDCTAVGEHHGHKPIVALKEMTKALKQRVLKKLDNVKTTRIPCAERFLSADEKVSSDLSSQAEQVRAKIISSRKAMIDAVELLFEQKLAEVDDLEEIRLKHPDLQKDELKLRAEDLKSLLHFGEKALEADVEAEEALHVLDAVVKRGDDL